MKKLAFALLAIFPVIALVRFVKDIMAMEFDPKVPWVLAHPGFLLAFSLWFFAIALGVFIEFRRGRYD